VTFSSAQPVLVVDASVAIEMLRPDPAWSARVAAWLGAGTMLLAPRHFPFELANALLRSLRLPVAEVTARLAQTERLGVETADLGAFGMHDVVELAARHGLSVYDAAYLELAMNVDGHLATLDRRLAAAAAAEGIEVVIDPVA
jgi:predicted nucleic acid-binding protein